MFGLLIRELHLGGSSAPDQGGLCFSDAVVHDDKPSGGVRAGRISLTSPSSRVARVSTAWVTLAP